MKKEIETAEKIEIKWDDYKDELYTFFGKCPCGNTNVIVGSKYCSECGKVITNPLKVSPPRIDRE